MIDISQIKEHGIRKTLSRLWIKLIFYLLAIGYKITRRVVHVLFAIFYFNRGSAVPPLKNGLLFKSATQLAADIREGRLKSEDVVQAYIDRIIEVEPYINATTHRRFTEAINEAKLADELIETGQMTRKQLAAEKPLLGIPISVKLNIKIKGVPLSGGSLDSKNAVATEDAHAIKYMKRAGAIVLVSTNAPEKAMGIETTNKLFGRTNNPYNTCRSCGGSSGGEGALLGAGASLIGLGNDTAGSVRIPPLFCGVFGHLPSENLVFPHGQLINTGNFTTIAPMCRYAEDLITAMKVLMIDKGVKIDRKIDFPKLKVYYIFSMDTPFSIAVDPEIKQTISKVASYFKISYRAKVREANLPLLKESSAMYWHKLISSIDIEEVKEILGIPKDLNTTSEILKSLVGLSTYTFNIPFLLKFLKCPLWYYEKRVAHYKSLTQQLQQELEELLDEDSILLCPTLPYTAPYHTEVRMSIMDVNYLSIWNILGLPATQCPLGLDKNGIPLGLQVIAAKNNDSLTLAIALELEKAFGGWIPPRRK